MGREGEGISAGSVLWDGEVRHTMWSSVEGSFRRAGFDSGVREKLAGEQVIGRVPFGGWWPCVSKEVVGEGSCGLLGARDVFYFQGSEILVISSLLVKNTNRNLDG